MTPQINGESITDKTVGRTRETKLKIIFLNRQNTFDEIPLLTMASMTKKLKLFVQITFEFIQKKGKEI